MWVNRADLTVRRHVRFAPDSDRKAHIAAGLFSANRVDFCPFGRRLLNRLADVRNVRKGRVEDGRGSLGHLATLRFPSPLIEPDVPD